MRDHSKLELMLKGYGLTTARILYHLPDHPHLLQTFIWQEYDLAVGQVGGHDAGNIGLCNGGRRNQYQVGTGDLARFDGHPHPDPRLGGERLDVGPPLPRPAFAQGSRGAPPAPPPPPGALPVPDLFPEAPAPQTFTVTSAITPQRLPDKLWLGCHLLLRLSW